MMDCSNRVAIGISLPVTVPACSAEAVGDNGAPGLDRVARPQKPPASGADVCEHQEVIKLSDNGSIRCGGALSRSNRV